MSGIDEIKTGRVNIWKYLSKFGPGPMNAMNYFKLNKTTPSTKGTGVDPI